MLLQPIRSPGSLVADNLPHLQRRLGLILDGGIVLMRRLELLEASLLIASIGSATQVWCLALLDLPNIIHSLGDLGGFLVVILLALICLLISLSCAVGA